VRCAAAASDAKNYGMALQSLDEIITSGECYSLDGLAVTGRDLLALGHLPGPKLGDTLNKLLDYAVVNPNGNNRETLLSLVESTDL